MLSQFSLNNGYEVETKIFSGGEVQVTLKPMLNAKSSGANVICLLAHLKCANGIIALAQIKQILNRDFPDSKIYLIMPYVPYARQDRAMVKGDAFSLKVFTSILNSLKFARVYITDPHSDVTPALIDNVRVTEQHEAPQFEQLFAKGYDALVSPDGGALKKIYKAAKALGALEVIKADKIRDVTNGQIIATEVHGNAKDKKLLIVDDIGEGLGTFIPLANKLKENGAISVDLYVTHGLFTKGIDFLDGIIDNVYCQYPWMENIVGRNTKGILKVDEK